MFPLLRGRLKEEGGAAASSEGPPPQLDNEGAIAIEAGTSQQLPTQYFLITVTFLQYYSVQEKLCLLSIHCNLSLAYISLQDIFNALNALRVYSHSYWLAISANFCTTNCSPLLVRERWPNNEHYWKKNTIFTKHPVPSKMKPHKLKDS